jgi:hypothetical protein
MCGELSSFYTQAVVVFLYNLTDMHRKASAGLGLWVAMVPESYHRASSTVSRHLAEVFAKNLELKGFEDIVPMSLHTYADVFSETAFDSLPERHKWDHTIEL